MAMVGGTKASRNGMQDSAGRQKRIQHGLTGSLSDLTAGFGGE